MNSLVIYAHNFPSVEIGMSYEKVQSVFENYGFSLQEVSVEAYEYLYKDFLARFSVEDDERCSIENRMVTCCAFGPVLVWRNPRFFANFDFAGFCVSYHTFADRVCSSCSAVWERQVFVESRVGCGRHRRYHSI